MSNRKKIYFASDFHFGSPDYPTSLKREKKVVKWLDEIKDDAEEIYLLGDIFDFWFEYKTVVPKGYIRLLGKLSELRERGIPIYFFTGNHDLWMFGYLEKELDIPVYKQNQQKTIKGKKFYLGHGDGIGPKDKGFKILKKVFQNRGAQIFFSLIHPAIGVKLANFWSRSSRKGDNPKMKKFLGEKEEWQIIYANEVLQNEHFDFFVFGHRHLPIYFPLNEKSIYVNLGDWLTYNSYAVFDGEKMELKYYDK